MEDSLEDYIRICRNSKESRKLQTESKTTLKEALIIAQKRKECEARAVKIVEFLIEGKLRPEVFLRCLKHINQSYYQDVVEERALGKLCGYSLCGKEILDMPKKQFYINTKANKVYDITDRKNYCSNFCYKASNHIKQQIDSSPLWLRKLEDCPTFNLLPLTERGSPGEEVDQGLAKPPMEPAFTSVTSFTEMSLTDMEEMEIKRSKSMRHAKIKELESMSTLYEADENDSCEKQIMATKHQQEAINIVALPLNDQKHSSIINDENTVSSSGENSILPTTNKPKAVKEKKPATNRSSKSKAVTQDILPKIGTYVHEWLTIETYLFLYGEDKMKGLLNENQLKDHLDKLKIAESTAGQQQKYLKLCKKLHLNQLADEKLDRVFLGTKLKPLPDYRQIQEESKSMNLKVKSFYSGVSFKSAALEVSNENENPEKKMEDSEKSEECLEVMPLMDSQAQNAIRRKVYLSSISKAMVNLTPNLGISSHHIAEDLHSLVKTFKLQAHNVVFQPAVRTLIALILLKMLAIRSDSLAAQLRSKQAQSFIKIIVGHFPKGEAFFEDFFKSIEDVDAFLAHYCSDT